jgi:hypothetical protein
LIWIKARERGCHCRVCWRKSGLSDESKRGEGVQWIILK